MIITNQRKLRAYFWDQYPDLKASTFMTHEGKRKTQNDFNATIRTKWYDFVDACNKNGVISDALADRATL